MTDLLFPGQPMRIYEVPEFGKPDEWAVQVKKNGRRCIIRCQGDDAPVELFNRHGEPLTGAMDWSWLREIFPTPFLLDGEELGSRQAGKRRNRLVLFDVIRCGYELAMPYAGRWAVLDDLLGSSLQAFTTSLCGIGVTVWQGKASFVGIIHNHDVSERSGATLWGMMEIVCPNAVGIDEGLVFKKVTASLAWHTRPDVKDPNQLKLRRKG